MLLGLPYGINDNHYKIIFDVVTRSMSQVPVFVLRCAILSGKIIDRNLTPGKPSLAKAMELDEELDSLASILPEGWWSISSGLPQETAELDSFREKLLQQFYFFWIKLYLHLPFLVKSSVNSSHFISRAACMDAARQVLRRYRLLRAKTDTGFSLFECKTSDFACFTASVIILIGNFHCKDMPRSLELNHDVELVASVDRILQREEIEKNCKIASQCRKTLELLLGNHDGRAGRSETADGLRGFVIPYFGIVIRKRIEQKSPPQPTIHNPNTTTDHPPCYEPNEMLTPSGMAHFSWDTDAFSLEYVHPYLCNGSMELDDPSFPQDGSLSWLDNIGVDWDSNWGILTDADLLDNSELGR